MDQLKSKGVHWNAKMFFCYFNYITSMTLRITLHRNITLTEHNTFVTFEAAVEASANKIREQLRQLPWLTNQNRNRVNQGFSLNIYIYIVPLAISCTLPIYDNLPNLGPRKILYFPCLGQIKTNVQLWLSYTQMDGQTQVAHPRTATLTLKKYVFVTTLV